MATSQTLIPHLKYFLLPLIAGLVSCSGFDADDKEPDVKPAEQVKGVRMPAGLEDCKIFRVFGDGGFVTLITRCPNSTTSTVAGKVQTTLAEEEPEDVQ